MTNENNETLRQVKRLSYEMLALADEGDQYRNDSSCGILYGILRDMAYRLRRTAEEERERHIKAGIWDKDSQAPRRER